MMSGRMALRVIAVSISVSPFFTLELPTAMFITSAPSRLPASSNEDCVRVEASKNRLICVRPRKVARFFSTWREMLDRLVGEIEQRLDLRAVEAFDAEQVAVGENGRRVGDMAGASFGLSVRVWQASASEEKTRRK